VVDQRFNGAALLQRGRPDKQLSGIGFSSTLQWGRASSARKTADGWQCLPLSGRFNGAALLQRGRHAGDRQEARLMILLQWGRASSARKTLRATHLFLPERSASMGPRFFSAEDEHGDPP